MHRTVLHLVVLSEEPIPDGMDVAAVVRESDEGDYVMSVEKWDSEQITDEQMCEALIAAGSDPGFFFSEEAEEGAR